MEAFDCAENEEHGKMIHLRKHGLSVECEIGQESTGVDSWPSNERTLSKLVRTLKSDQTHG